MISSTHVDYAGMQVLNTVFGGYFGSRLMSNIREDKGYTYGIGSSVVPLRKEGYFCISSEVGVDVRAAAVNEIYLELKRLRTELVPESELNLVRNYMLGSFQRNIDGPFSLADRFKSILTAGMGYEYYTRYLETIQNITAEELLRLASTHLHEDSLYELVVGG